MAKDYKETMQSLAGKLKEDKPQTPIQEVVRPVKPVNKRKRDNTPPDDAAYINFWIPGSMMEELKIYAIRNKTTLRELGTQALEQLLTELRSQTNR